MKLNTKNIFCSSLKTTPKTKYKKSKKSNVNEIALNSNKKIKNKTNHNSKVKQKLFQSSNRKNNPFIQTTEENYGSKIINPTKKNTQKIVNIKFIDEEEKNDLFDDSYSYSKNVMLTSKTNTIKNNKIKERIKTFNNTKSNKNNLNQLYNLYKKSIIIDNFGNNNLNYEQKKLIKNYFKKKSHASEQHFRNNFFRLNIKKQPTQIYKNNNLLMNKIYHLKTSTIDTNDKTNPINKKIDNLLKNNYFTNKNNCKTIKEKDNEDSNRKLKIKTDKKMEQACFLLNTLLIKEEENQKKIEENSVFEASSHISFDSSFLGSSFDIDFYQNLNKN